MLAWFGDAVTRQPLIAANWKMYKAPGEAAVLAQDVIARLSHRQQRDLELVFCPSTIALSSVSAVLRFERTAIRLGAQDVNWQPDGALTGATSARMLVEVGCRYCLVGHSERRYYFQESDQDISLKLAALMAAQVTPILCVGESWEIRSVGSKIAARFVVQQLRAALGPLDAGLLTAGTGLSPGLVVAYEPIWSIGTGQTSTPASAQEMAVVIRSELSRLFGQAFANQARILYGGSLKPSNVAPFSVLPDIDGGLVGGSSLDALEFSDLVLNFLQARRSGIS